MSGFAGLRVLALESRRAAELAKLISTYGGEPVVAPAMREVPLESNTEALGFAARLLAGEFDLVIFLTGVGARALLSVVETTYKRGEYIAALQRVKVVARGPKPVAVLRERLHACPFTNGRFRTIWLPFGQPSKPSAREISTRSSSPPAFRRRISSR